MLANVHHPGDEIRLWPVLEVKYAGSWFLVLLREPTGRQRRNRDNEPCESLMGQHQKRVGEQDVS